MIDFNELASVDGKVTATADATIGLKDDGLYAATALSRDPDYAGATFALASTSTARPIRARDRARFDRAAGGRDHGAARAGRPARRKLRLIVNRGGRRIAATERSRSRRFGPGRHDPLLDHRHPRPRQVALLPPPTCTPTRRAKQDGADEACWSAATGSCWSSRPRRSSGRPPTAPCAPLARASDPRLDHPRPACRRARGRGGQLPLDDLSPPPRPSRLDHREVQAIAAVDDVELPSVPGPRTLEASRPSPRRSRASSGPPDEPGRHRGRDQHVALVTSMTPRSKRPSRPRMKAELTRAATARRRPRGALHRDRRLRQDLRRRRRHRPSRAPAR